MFWNNKRLNELTEEDKVYLESRDTGNGVGGFGLAKLPMDKSSLKSGWFCPKCDSVYSPYIKECKKCNEIDEEVRKVEQKRKKNTKQRRHND